MNDDMYLSLVAELYENGTWTKEIVRKKLKLYAEENNIDNSIIEDLIQRITMEKEYSLEEKKAFLSVIRLMDGKELKYGDVVDSMSDDTIERMYQFEVSSLSSDKIEELHDLAGFKSSQEKMNESVDEVSAELKKEKYIAPANWYTPYEKTVPWYEPLNAEEVKHNDEVVEKETVMKPVIENATISAKPAAVELDIPIITPIVDNITTQKEQVDFEPGMPSIDPIVENVRIEEEPVTLEKTVIPSISEMVLEPNPEEGINVENEPIIIGDIFNSVDIPDMAQTEEEFKEVEKNINSPEKDSTVRKVDASEERINKLKKGKGKVINYFVKTAIIVAGIALVDPISTGILTFGYLHFAKKIENGEFIPKNKFQELVKNTIEKIMYVGMNKDVVEEERGKTR